MSIKKISPSWWPIVVVILLFAVLSRIASQMILQRLDLAESQYVVGFLGVLVMALVAMESSDLKSKKDIAKAMWLTRVIFLFLGVCVFTSIYLR